ncbi:hypothetical protein HYPSUDRAFT_960801 [Hypholoma sublateritium FD-334 SS-4]|uniref:Uncharacterized protein n=1 Tax=Hypholoma sublateritium (strain FD-334 SS-4) TaxID=945553 RepID=A0A0D2KUJ8_HYPSF|nr:hypothetical protein HYPSUDRAFT_960801 [Hypholoma sublateritium FD-334 SS-4]
MDGLSKLRGVAAQHDRWRGWDALISRLWETIEVAVAGDVEGRSPLKGLTGRVPVRSWPRGQDARSSEAPEVVFISRNSSKISDMWGRLKDSRHMAQSVFPFFSPSLSFSFYFIRKPLPLCSVPAPPIFFHYYCRSFILGYPFRVFVSQYHYFTPHPGSTRFRACVIDSRLCLPLFLGHRCIPWVLRPTLRITGRRLFAHETMFSFAYVPSSESKRLAAPCASDRISYCFQWSVEPRVPRTPAHTLDTPPMYLRLRAGQELFLCHHVAKCDLSSSPRNSPRVQRSESAVQ